MSVGTYTQVGASRWGQAGAGSLPVATSGSRSLNSASRASSGLL